MTIQRYPEGDFFNFEETLPQREHDKLMRVRDWAQNQVRPIAVSNDKLFAALATALERTQWLEDPRFATYDARFDHRAEMRAEINGALSGFTVEQAVDRLQQHGVPTAPVVSVRTALRNEHATHRGLIAREEDGFETLASPLRLRGSVAPQRAPEPNQDIDYVLNTVLKEPPR